MENQDARIAELLQRLETLSQQQTTYQKSLNDFRVEIHKIKKELMLLQKPSEQKALKQEPRTIVPLKVQDVAATPGVFSAVEKIKPTPKSVTKSIKPKKSEPTDYERLIGENLINKLGILILVIGVGIGAKYSIDNNLINPETRIILGYIVGAGLLGFAFKLKPKYENFSAVLLGGAMSILYFITYFAYSFYGLIPQALAFVLMAIFTAFTAFAATIYNRQVIALLGLIGAYAVPFLLSNNTGNFTFLFSYIFIVNLGILFLAYKKDWRALNNVAFFLTWVIFIGWAVVDYNMFDDGNFGISLLFTVLYFLTFYGIALAFRLKENGKLNFWNVSFMCINALIFYGITYALFSENETTKDYLGLLTLAHAFIHFMVATVLFRSQNDKKSLFFLATTMTLVFLTIAIPVQLDGNWVTILWAVEAVLLLWIAKNKALPIFEKLAYPALFLAVGSLIDDWGHSYGNYYGTKALMPIFNEGFLSGIVLTVALGTFLWMHLKSDIKDTKIKTAISRETLTGFLSISFIGMLYIIFFLEINQYFQSLFQNSRQTGVDPNTLADLTGYNYSILQFKAIWVLNYTMSFLGILSFFVLKKVKSTTAISINLLLNALAIFAFLSVGLQLFGALRNDYLDTTSQYGKSGMFIGIRYISMLFFGFLGFATYKLSKHKSLTINVLTTKKIVEVSFALSLLTLLSSELLHWLQFSGNQDATKHHLSILWGIFALGLVFLGINKKKKHLRLLGIALFGVTLLKLFLYDIGQLGTIGKTIVFVSLGVLLLLISFLYNKYKHLIFDDDAA